MASDDEDTEAVGKDVPLQNRGGHLVVAVCRQKLMVAKGLVLVDDGLAFGF
jgi:hypothetical protein